MWAIVIQNNGIPRIKFISPSRGLIMKEFFGKEAVSKSFFEVLDIEINLKLVH